jgi:hypothetical protein
VYSWLCCVVLFCCTDERGLQESFTQHNQRVKSTRRSTLESFNISEDGTSSAAAASAAEAAAEGGGEVKATRRLSTVKALASTFDK